MDKFLLIGDLHVKKNNLAESALIFNKLYELAKDHDYAVHLGDIYNDHGVVTADVQSAVTNFFDTIKPKKAFYNIEGNHDQHGNMKDSSLYVHKSQPNVNLVLSPNASSLKLDGYEVAMIPYFRTNEDFERELVQVLSGSTRFVLCHQEFKDLTFYTPNGFDASKYSVNFISGHIHDVIEKNNVWYVGSPRWLTKSDANKDRGVWSVTIDKGLILDKTFVSFSDIIPVIKTLTVSDEDVNAGSLPAVDPKDKLFLEYVGNSLEVLATLKKIYPNASVTRTPIVQKKETKVSESKGVRNSIIECAQSLELEENLKKKVLEESLRRISV
jgi:DNA repair exonuclease SbcCD nuclease subunit